MEAVHCTQKLRAIQLVMVQLNLKLSKTCMWNALNTTRFYFHTHAGMHVLDVCTKYVCMSGVYKLKLVCVHLGMYTNHRTRITK